MSGQLDRHSYHGRLTGDNIDGVADRLRATLLGRPFILVRSSPSSNDGTPRSRSSSSATRAGAWSSAAAASFCFAAREGSRIAFEGHVFTISEYSPSGHLHHWVFAPEGSGE
ncbi:hypothetical protein FAF44_02705 [Nonomuraea sp. MG754425]|uniref:hypothetical protein n=1 Tax=Nonomuraea sp. MG754425 TaxID=2570319 RepID=UPI001F2EDE38|nr:hypothetical protein [Nonomuraea sp. MG754425]MCF6467324.1 hypothetical protein [Nonomuraea sp. MG754425]